MKPRRIDGWPQIRRVFALDLRSLAAFRIALALFVLYDLVNRSLDLTAHYTDDGVIPRATLLANLWNPHVLSVHMFTGTALGVALLFFLHGLAAFGLLVGYRTRLMTFVTWFLLCSLHARNPLVLNGGDDLLRVIFLFAILLPLGARYSLDAALNVSNEDSSASELYGSPSTAAYYIQFICLYFFAALLKSGPEWRTDGTAIYYALSIDQFALPLGKFLLGFPALMKTLTFVVWWIEFLGTFVMLIPLPWAKIVGILVFLSLQIGFGLTLALGHFPWVNMIVLLPFLPSLVWRSGRKRGVEVFFDPGCDFCRKLVLIAVEFVRPKLNSAPKAAQGKELAALRGENLWMVRDETGARYFEFGAFIQLMRSSSIFFWTVPLLRWKPVHLACTTAYRFFANHRRFLDRLLSLLKPRPLRMKTHRWQEALVLFLMTLVLISNLSPFLVADSRLKDFLETPIMMTRTDEYWGMFAPAPTPEDGWYVVVGRLRDGWTIDAFREKRTINYSKPASAADFYPNERWRKYMMNIWLRNYKEFRAPFAHYLCRSWNGKNSGADHMDRVTVTFMLERTPPPGGEAKVEKIVLGDYRCLE